MKTMGWTISLLYFGIPALAMAAGFYLFMPMLVRRGIRLLSKSALIAEGA